MALSLLLNALQEGKTLWIMCIPTSSMRTELYPFPTWATYTPLSRQTKPTKKTVTTWPEDALPRLQDCFENTQWEAFYHEDLEIFTDAVLSYIKYCIGNVTVEKRIWVFPNQKPWMTRQVRMLLRARDSAFRSGDRALYSAARANLKRGIRTAKGEYKRRIEEHLNNPRQVWRGIQTITNYKGCAVTPGNLDAGLAEELNSFFARFEWKCPSGGASWAAAGSPSTLSHASFTFRSAQTRCHRLSFNGAPDSTRTSRGPFPTSKENTTSQLDADEVLDSQVFQEHPRGGGGLKQEGDVRAQLAVEGGEVQDQGPDREVFFVGQEARVLGPVGRCKRGQMRKEVAEE
ncbi:unnamed protein product [Menidia menidia]|uniref:(Atlantic silverside) hypothetical protein n=1 Tax=Menidia menidia TaxID=238744 RepID=A0A8S4AQ88_9TELE|nr:unnamed protein product [Menidia menidia]